METDENPEQTILESNSKDAHAQERIEKQQQLIVIQTSKVNYLKDMMSFVKQIEAAIPKLSRLLFSKTQTDVLEVISFFVTCYEHGLVDMLFGIRKMLSLVLYSEKTIKDAVINAYKRLYLTPKSATAQTPVQIAKQLIKLTQDLSLCERDALEELIGEFSATGELDNAVIKVFWEIFASADQPAQHKLYALILLGMIIKKVPEKGKVNIQVLIDYGLSLSSDENDASESATDLDMLRFSETCLALSYITIDANTKHLTQQEAPNKPAESTKGKRKALDTTTATTNKEDSTQRKLQFNNEPFKLPLSHQLFEKISHLLVSQFSNKKTIYWMNLAENAMHCVFKLADNPILVIESMASKLVDKMPVFKPLLAQQLPPVPLFNEPVDSLAQNEESSVNSVLLSRFIGLVGLLATKLLVFLNQYVVCELKRRKMCKENQTDANTMALSSKSKSTLNNSSSSSNSKSRRRLSVKLMKTFNQNSGDAALEEEMGLQGAEAEDVELLLIETIINQRVAVSQPQPGANSFLAQFLHLIVYVLKEPLKFKDDSVQIASAMALVKLMLLTPKLCNENLQLLFTLMEKSPNATVRSQLIIGVGDLVYRFPNALEPWTSHLYLPLRDTKSTTVRMNTIRVLSHLILKEMIKTRGQIYEIALCTIDPDAQICALAKLFFQELSQRNNGLVIYNAMPDIISQLSGGGGGTDGAGGGELDKARTITEDAFRSIVTYLFTFIKRDKQCETLIEKLCHAFRQANTSERKCRDLVFCLSKIQLSESGIKKLKETFKWYADKLIIPAVYETFKQTILKNARKLPMLKNETKMLIDELEKQIDDVKQKGLEGENAPEPMEENDGENEEQAAPVAQGSKKGGKKAAPAPVAKKPVRSSGRKKGRVESSDEEDDDSDDSSDDSD
jgi:condensin complex subunit 1